MSTTTDTIGNGPEAVEHNIEASQLEEFVQGVVADGGEALLGDVNGVAFVQTERVLIEQVAPRTVRGAAEPMVEITVWMGGRMVGITVDPGDWLGIVVPTGN